MFDYLFGKMTFLSQNQCVVDTHGIGWSLIISTKTSAIFSGKNEVKAYTFLNMGSADRASMELYGFASVDERDFFTRLIGVSGIGPKAAMSILSVLSPEELALCVLSGDAKAITAAPGIGLKGAQKIILELKDRISKNSVSSSLPVTPNAAAEASGIVSEAVNALVVLGYSPQVAASAVRKVSDRADNLQDMIRLALKSIGDTKS